jgi:hypothetical protein
MDGAPGRGRKTTARKHKHEKMMKNVAKTLSRRMFTGREANAAQLHKELIEVRVATDTNEKDVLDPGSECRPQS